MSHNLCPVSKKGCFWLTGHKWLNANEPSAPCYFPCCSALPPSRPPQKSPSITTMRSRCCYAPPNSKSDATQHSPLDRPCTLHRLPIRCCFEGGYRSPGSPQTLSSSSEHDRFGRSSSPPSMLVPVAHTPTRSNVPTMRILRLFSLSTGRYSRGEIQHNNLQITVMQIDDERSVSRTKTPH